MKLSVPVILLVGASLASAEEFCVVGQDKEWTRLPQVRKVLQR